MNTPATGIAFPAQSGGERSSTRAGAAIVAAALAPLSKTHAEAALAEDHWRRAYPRHFRRLVEGGLASADAALASARAGLEEAWERLVWTDAGSADRPLAAAFAPLLTDDRAPPLQTRVLRGEGEAAPAPWAVPYRGEALTGSRLARRIDAWEREGIIEPGAAASLRRCAQHPEWFDLSDRHLVLLGAASEAGPLRWLAKWRANIIAVDLDRPAAWERVWGHVKQGNATLHVPLRASVAKEDDWLRHAGVDLIAETPAVAHWLRSLAVQLDVAAHGYVDGERHVRLAMAMDFVQRACCEARPHTTLAFMATPTDVFAVPRAAAEAAMQAWRSRPIVTRTLQQPLRLATGDRFFQPNVPHLLATREGAEYGVVDSLVIEQGPNYALAKRLQQWRALVARAAGHRVSLNIAPSTTTASVVKNPALAAGFAGADTFGIEVFEPETTNALMAALWVHDLRYDGAAAHPVVPLAHPFELFMANACHGGLWRTAYLPRSALPFAAALGWVRSRGGRGR